MEGRLSQKGDGLKHQPLTLAHEERVRLINHEIIYYLGINNDLNGADNATFTRSIADTIP